MTASTNNNKYRVDPNPPKQIYDVSNIGAGNSVNISVRQAIGVYIVSDPDSVILPDPELLKPGDELHIRLAWEGAFPINLELNSAAVGTLEGLDPIGFGIFPYTGVGGPGSGGGVTLRVCRPNDRTQPNDWRIVGDWQQEFIV